MASGVIAYAALRTGFLRHLTFLGIQFLYLEILCSEL